MIFSVFYFITKQHKCQHKTKTFLRNLYNFKEKASIKQGKIIIFDKKIRKIKFTLLTLTFI